MNWDESQMASQAFAQGQGGMSLGQQWALAAMLRTDKPSKSKKKSSQKPVNPVKKP
jgi:hypothetical protein